MIVSLDVARAAVARCWLGASTRDSLGTVTLRPHQARAVSRLRAALARHRGALLADAVGLGKTYVALAIARDARHPLVVAPAALRTTWRRAAERCGVHVDFVSHEALSRRAPDAARESPDLLIVDEAHHARNPATRRWHALAALAASARVLLVSATPVHNSTRDLRALLSLFLGERARRLAGPSLLRLVVRRDPRDVPDGNGDADDDAPALPRVARTRWRTMAPDDAVGRALDAIPPPLPTAGGATGGALWRIGLVRAWASSDGALRNALRRRLAVAAALECALDDGRLPTRRELRAWSGDVHAVQLAFPLLMADATAGDDVERWRDVVRAHVDGVRVTLGVLAARPDRDARRATWLRALRRRHAGASIVAFTHSADTARTLWRRLVPDGGVALLTASGGEVAGGTLSRAELLARFAPRATGAPVPNAAERVTLLVATDCLSEGIDLRDASVVVHLDLPWTPARLAQRVGRAARLGALHARIAVHGLAPPLHVRRALRIAARLRVKQSAARRAGVGDSRRAGSKRESDAECAVALGRLLERWLSDRQPSIQPASHASLVAAARGNGFLAACLDDRGPFLVAGTRRVTDDVRVVLRAARRVARATSCDGSPSSRDVAAIERRIARWHRTARAERVAGLSITDAATPLARALLARADAAVRALPAHRRARGAALTASLRQRLREPLPAAAERALAALLALPADAAWLDALAARLPAIDARPARNGSAVPRVIAMVLLRPGA